MKYNKRCFLAILLGGLLFPVMAWAGTAVGILDPSGSVTVNGQPVTGTTPLFVGDVVQSGPNSSAAIIQSGSVTVLPNNSSARCGGVSITVTSLTSSNKGYDEGNNFKNINYGDHEKCRCRFISPHKPEHHHHNNHECDDDY